VPHWLDTVVTLLCAETADLRELARIVGANPKTFYRGIDPGNLDLIGQDLQGMEFKAISAEDTEKIRNATTKEERLSMLLDSILQNRSNGLQILDSYNSDRSSYANDSLEELRKVLTNEPENRRVDNVSLVRALRRPLAHQLGGSRANLIYYMAKHLSKYPDIKGYLRKSYLRSTSSQFDRYRHEIEKLLM
jgi:hypothetical protein